MEPVAGGRSYGTWLVSTVLGAPQSFIHEGRTYALSMRPRRYYLPYSVTLKKFSHDVYPGTDIPKNFSSLVHLSNPARGEERDVLIYMNQPLRYDGKAFYQASYGKGDTLSILQVVANPGWLLPYISCALDHPGAAGRISASPCSAPSSAAGLAGEPHETRQAVHLAARLLALAAPCSPPPCPGGPVRGFDMDSSAACRCWRAGGSSPWTPWPGTPC